MSTAQTNSEQRGMSLLSYGSRRQFAVVVALISVIPLLLLWYLTVQIASGEYSTIFTWEAAIIAGCIAMLIGLGVMILKHYLANITRLRHSLEQLVKGEFPDAVQLINCADDIEAIQKALNVLVGKKREELLAVERRKVMVESLGTACHHFGQPLAVLSCCLDTLDKDIGEDDETRQLLRLSQEAVDSLLGAVENFKNTTEYKTEPYWQSSEEPAHSSSARILVL